MAWSLEGKGRPGVDACWGCPSRSSHRYALDPERLAQAAPGVLQRVSPASPAGSDDPEVDEARRNVLKLALVGGVAAVAVAGGVSALRYLLPPTAGASSYPSVQLQYEDGTPILVSQYRYGPSDVDLILFNYPLTNEPNMLLNLGEAAPNGVGPAQSLVAFSAICQHLGCVPPYISYYPAGACGSFHGGQLFIHCICHGSTYDPLTEAAGGGAAILTGPTQSPLPQVVLSWDKATDYLYAVGMIGPPVRGHSSTLTGGSPVTSPEAAAAPLTPTQQCPI